MRVGERIGLALAGRLAPLVFRGVYSSLRYELAGERHLEGWKAGRAVVFVTWHGRILPLLHLFRGHAIVMLVSRHRDGEYLTRLGRRLGYDAVRGSSTHGGYSALRELVRRLRSGCSLAITPDGPQGPREKVKTGALQAARISGAPVIPVMAGGRRAWWIEGWDRFMVPKPYARIRVVVGEPRVIPPGDSVAELEAHARRLEADLQMLKAEADG
jgi:lysophospholipid acyltransferase (LPLAT)-like uncharacterized protein